MTCEPVNLREKKNEFASLEGVRSKRKTEKKKKKRGLDTLEKGGAFSFEKTKGL